MQVLLALQQKSVYISIFFSNIMRNRTELFLS